MKIAIVSPYGSSIKHRVRGTGSYFENLKEALKTYDSKNSYFFPSLDQNIPNDLDLVHYPFFEPFFLSIPVFKKYKTVVTVHDLTPLAFPQHFSKGILGSIKWQIQKRSLKNADSIITDSGSSKKDIIRYAGINENKINVVYLAAGKEFKKLDVLDSKIVSKYKLPKNFALYVGDVTWNKNLPRLVEAAEKSGFPLIMVGKALVDKEFDKNNAWNKDLGKVQKMISVSKNVRALGFIPKEDLVDLYNLAQFFVMPSIYEGFGLPVLEALSCGCPVVTSKNGSLEEVAGDTALYVDPYSVDSITKGIERISKDPNLRKKLSEEGLKQAKKFSWEKTVKETIKIYESLND